MTAWWLEQETTADDAERVTLALAPKVRGHIATLLQLDLLVLDRAQLASFTRMSDAELTVPRRHLVRQLLWYYRRLLPDGVRPKVNPDDPIVREMTMQQELADV